MIYRQEMKLKRKISCISIAVRMLIVYLMIFPNVMNEKQKEYYLCSSIISCNECTSMMDCMWCLDENLRYRCTSLLDNLTCFFTNDVNGTNDIYLIGNSSYEHILETTSLCEENIIKEGYLIWNFIRNTGILVIGAYIIIFIFGVVGNVAVIYVVFRCRRMRTTTNILIANLACADLLVIVFCLPIQLYNNLYSEWKFGEIFCKLVSYLQGVSVCASIFILMAISVERCLTICYPMICYTRNTIPKYVILCLWIFSFLLLMPWLLYFKVQPLEDEGGVHVCVESWPNVEIGNIYFIGANILLCYLLPLSVISVCFYCIWRRVSTRILPGENIVQCNAMIHRSKIKVTKMMLIVIILFTCSWLPLYIIFTFTKFGKSTDFIETLIPYAQWLGVSNSSVNPILYAFYNKNFRSTFKALFSGKTCCTSVQTYQSTTSSRTRTDILSNQGVSRTKTKKPNDTVTVISEKANRQIKRTMSSQVPMKSCVSLKAELLRGQSLDYI